MLTKCANPSCSASFRHLADGRLFRLETDHLSFHPTLGRPSIFGYVRPARLEAGRTLRLARDGTVATIRLADALCNGPYVALNSVDRENGASLRSVSFLPRSHPKGT
jgi:hypothetical protein